MFDKYKTHGVDKTDVIALTTVGSGDILLIKTIKLLMTLIDARIENPR